MSARFMNLTTLQSYEVDVFVTTSPSIVNLRLFLMRRGLLQFYAVAERQPNTVWKATFAFQFDAQGVPQDLTPVPPPTLPPAPPPAPVRIPAPPPRATGSAAYYTSLIGQGYSKTLTDTGHQV
jgi:hypothetical protein